ncbi:hypothetical protein [Rugamonas rubra]|uniref:Uncharacterized protein n=1 Tax=Rugamonas rubra TaxID=758825 RepID=A0A1I4K8F8_9BURK|nr:hypothetical protein [Rugamonas rubra]SFL74776.1 hypothetical protein SAMN02982985_01344 [Rugamonas rubra]
MSNTATFMERCLLGTALPEQIDDYVAQWHDGIAGQNLTLRDFLGMDRREYAAWMQDADAIHAILALKKNIQPATK